MSGVVSFVGAGPGDLELLTLKPLDRPQRAHAVHDRVRQADEAWRGSSEHRAEVPADLVDRPAGQSGAGKRPADRGAAKARQLRIGQECRRRRMFGDQRGDTPTGQPTGGDGIQAGRVRQGHAERDPLPPEQSGQFGNAERQPPVAQRQNRHVIRYVRQQFAASVLKDEHRRMAHAVHALKQTQHDPFGAAMPEMGEEERNSFGHWHTPLKH